jgi:hypothetical protein
MSTPKTPDQSAPTDSNAQRTRSGRVSKPPERYEPVEQVEDDYNDDEYDSDESDIHTDDSFNEDSDEETDEDDADEDGNLEGFVVPDKSESDSDDSDGESAVPVKKRTPATKRPVRK